jgi:hypothetical protein
MHKITDFCFNVVHGPFILNNSLFTDHDHFCVPYKSLSYTKQFKSLRYQRIKMKGSENAFRINRLSRGTNFSYVKHCQRKRRAMLIILYLSVLNIKYFRITPPNGNRVQNKDWHELATQWGMFYRMSQQILQTCHFKLKNKNSWDCGGG